MDARPARQALLRPRPAMRALAKKRRRARDSSLYYAYGLDAHGAGGGAARAPRRRDRVRASAVDRIPLPAYVGFLGDLYRDDRQPVLAGASTR